MNRLPDSDFMEMMATFLVDAIEPPMGFRIDFTHL